MALRGIAGKVAVVTGGGSGIGEGAAFRLSEDGARLVIVDWNEDAARSVAGSLPGPAIAVRADVSQEQEVAAYMQAALDEFGRVDLIHVNAGIAGRVAPFAEVSGDEFDEVIAVNLRGVFFGLRDGLRQFTRQGSGGAIVTTSSLAGLMGGDVLVPYIAAKHGVIGLTRSAAVAGAPLGVRVNSIAPGVIVTGLTSNLDDIVGSSNNVTARLEATIPLHRFGSKEEAGDLVAYLLSDEASYVSGAIITVDGGVTAKNLFSLPTQANN